MKAENNRIEFRLEMTPGTRVNLTGYIAKELDLNDEQVTKLDDVMQELVLYGWMWIGQRVEINGVVHVPSDKVMNVSSRSGGFVPNLSEDSVLHAKAISECAVDQLEQMDKVSSVVTDALEGRFEVDCGSMDPKESKEYIQGVKEMWEKAREPETLHQGWKDKKQG